MPQMSPLLWSFLMIFFIFFYLMLSIMIYYEFISDLGGQLDCGKSAVKFFIMFK